MLDQNYFMRESSEISDKMKQGMLRAAYSCGHSFHLPISTSWPPLKCQKCHDGNLLRGFWQMQAGHKAV
jgi:hypothetical protein